MELRERISLLVKYSGKQISEFSRFAGFKTPQAIRELIKGNTKTLSDAARIKIITAFPEINDKWLATGEGEMIRKDFTICGVSGNNSSLDSQVIQSIGEVSGQNAGRDINNSSVCSTETWLKELEAQRKLTEKAQEIAETTQKQLSVALAQIADLINQNKDQISYFMALFQSNKIIDGQSSSNP